MCYTLPSDGRQSALAGLPSDRNKEDYVAISVLLADDTTIVRKAIRELLDSSPGIKVVGEAADFNETLRMIEALKPNVVVMDLHMPGEVAVTPTELKDRLSLDASSLLAISIWSDTESHALAESYGASRLLDKMGISATLIQAIVDLAPIGAEPQLARTASA
jgi:DNA-binding NarL/FixJ family response regulator